MLLLDEEYPLKAVFSCSVKSLEDVASIGPWISQNLTGNSLDPRTSNRIALAVEEIGVYIIDQCGDDTPVDFLVSSNGSDYILTCRNPGESFCPIKSGEGELSPNELLLTNMFKISHEYVFGLNSTSLTIGARKA